MLLALVSPRFDMEYLGDSAILGKDGMESARSVPDEVVTMWPSVIKVGR